MAAEISTGPVFRPMLKGGRLQDERLSDIGAARIVKHYAERADLFREHAGAALL